MIERLRKSKEAERRSSSPQITECIRSDRPENYLDCRGSSDAWGSHEAEESAIVDDKSSHFSPEEIEKRVSMFIQERLARWNVPQAPISAIENETRENRTHML